MPSTIIFLGLGSNLGNREENIKKAIQLLMKSNVHVDKVSSLIETEPQGYLDQPKFLNGVVKASTDLSPTELLSTTQSIEKNLGRQTTFRNGPRTIDIDILIYGQEKICTPSLTIPHSRMWEREFVLIPLREIEPTFSKEFFQ